MAGIDRNRNKDFTYKIMKTNGWLILGMMLATSAVAQNNVNAPTAPPPPAGVAPATPVEAAPAAIAPQTDLAPNQNTAPAKPKKHKAVPPAKSIVEPTVMLVPGPAEAAVSINARGQAGLRGEVVAHLKKGDAVTVLSQINLDKHKAGEPAQWAKIALPSSMHAWINSRFVDATSKTVSVKKLNLRAGPGENYSVLGVIESGTPVKEIQVKGDWMEIESPNNAYAFVAAMYLTQAASTATVPQQPAMVAAQPVVELPPMDRIVSHEGVVGPVDSIIAPTAYKLYDPNTYQTIDYLYSTSPKLDLSRYVNMRIVVTGVEGLDARWKNQPVIAIQSIEVISTSAVKHVDNRSPRQRGN
jgi:uncharacterized protein YgiM (DUF1202 family)